MKKFLVLCGGIAIASASAAFALDLPDALKIPGLSVTGDVRTGLRVDGGTFDDFGKMAVIGVDPDGNPIEDNVFRAGAESGAVDPYVYAYSDDIDDGTPFRAQLQLVWQRDNLGVKTRFRYRPDATTTTSNLSATLNNLNNTINKAFVWGSILDGKAKVTLGKGLDDPWTLFYSNFSGAHAPLNASDPDSASNYTTVNVASFAKDGVMLEVTPIDGLNVGAYFGSPNLFNKVVKSNDPVSIDKGEGDRRFVVGAKYRSGAISVVASLYHNFYDWENATDGTYGNYYALDPNTSSSATYFSGDAFDNLDKALPNTSNLLVGFQFAPEDLGLTVDLSLAFANLGSMTYRESINHLSTEDIPGYKKGDYNPFWAFKPKLKVAYGIDDKLTVALGVSDLTFADMYYYDDADADNVEDRGMGQLFPITINPSVAYAVDENITASLDLNLKFNTNGSDQFGFGVKPAAEFSLGSGATFVVYDELTFWTMSNDETDFMKQHPTALQGGNHGASGTTNTLQFDFVWTF